MSTKHWRQWLATAKVTDDPVGDFIDDDAGSPFLVMSNNPHDNARCIAVAHELGATIEDSNGGSWVLPSVRSIMIGPPSMRAV
jgi:hypothetical protein